MLMLEPWPKPQTSNANRQSDISPTCPQSCKPDMSQSQLGCLPAHLLLHLHLWSWLLLTWPCKAIGQGILLNSCFRPSQPYGIPATAVSIWPSPEALPAYFVFHKVSQKERNSSWLPFWNLERHLMLYCLPLWLILVQLTRNQCIWNCFPKEHYVKWSTFLCES